MKRKWVIVAFGDILGFGVWSRRATNTPEVRQPFIKNFYETMQLFVEKSNCYMKYLGDGMLILKELPTSGHKCMEVKKFLQEMDRLTRQMRAVVRSCDWPTPEGFRMRVVAGHVDKLVVKNPQTRNGNVSEYVGYAVNLAQRLLEVSPSTPCICHESVIRILGKKRSSLQLRRLGKIKEAPRGVDQEDLSALWTFRHKENTHVEPHKAASRKRAKLQDNLELGPSNVFEEK